MLLSQLHHQVRGASKGMALSQPGGAGLAFFSDLQLQEHVTHLA